MVAWWMNSQNDNILCWNFKVVLLFLSDKTSNLCNHLGPRKTTQAHFRSYADLKLLWGPNSRVTCWVSSATRLSVTSCNAANASTLRWTLRHTPLNLKVTVSTPDIVLCIAVHSMPMQRRSWTPSNHFYLCLGSLLWVYGTRVFSFGQTFTEQSLDGTKYLIQLYICREADAALDHVNNFRCFLPERNNVEQRLVMLVMGPY